LYDAAENKASIPNALATTNGFSACPQISLAEQSIPQFGVWITATQET
jgi:hypothetical protein